ncbi:MAG: alanine racemase, partial [Solirubrobacteraceae bacterium]
MSAISTVERRVYCGSIAGIPLELLAERAGGTPFFAYDRSRLSERIELLRSALPAGIELSYAVKANPIPAVVQHLAALVDSFDVASAAEMRVALDTPMPADHVSFAGPGKTPAELTQAIAAGVTIEMESETEAERVAMIGERLGVRPRVAVRFNPDFQIKGSGMRMGGGPQQFGVDAERVPALLQRLARLDLEVLGFHIFAGSQNLNADILCDAQRKTVGLALSLAEAAPAPVRYLNLGGGFGIPYFDRDQPLDLAAIGSNLQQLLAEEIRSSLPDARVVVELGRYIVGECGFYV